jgi:hypothetical protein
MLKQKMLLITIKETKVSFMNHPIKIGSSLIKGMQGVAQYYSEVYELTELNLEDGDSSPNLKVWVSSPWM